MMLKVRFKPQTSLRQKIVDKYTYLYTEYCKSVPLSQRTYTRSQLRNNIRNVISVGKTSVEEIVIKEPMKTEWSANGWKVIPCNKHWYFAVEFALDSHGKLFLEIQDCCYEGDYHNDTMNTKPYESITRLIREAVQPILNLERRWSNLK